MSKDMIEFYADESNYEERHGKGHHMPCCPFQSEVERDRGKKARQALAERQKEPEGKVVDLLDQLAEICKRSMELEQDDAEMLIGEIKELLAKPEQGEFTKYFRERIDWVDKNLHDDAVYLIKPGREACDRIDEQMDEIDKLESRLIEWTEKEAAVCPEDVGFDEYIKMLKTHMAKLRVKNAELNIILYHRENGLSHPDLNNEILQSRLAESEDENKELREVMQFYANDCSYEERGGKGHHMPCCPFQSDVERDRGKKARDLLKEGE